MAIVDNRTSLFNAEGTTNLVNLTGSATAFTTDPDIKIRGSNSLEEKVSGAVDGLLYNYTTSTNRANYTYYFWVNVLTAGLLDIAANGGIRMRFCGPTITNWFEVYLDGSDTYSGGWKMYVVNIEDARALAVTNGWTNGTTPATSAIQYVGIVFDMAGMLSGNLSNCFVDESWELAQNAPGIRVEGQNTGSVDWTWQDIVDAGDVGDTLKAWGTVFNRDGIIFFNTPVRFGANDAVTHGFSDTNVVVAWEEQLVPDGFYEIEIIGGTGTQSFELGLKSGTGDDATGSQGGAIVSSSVGPRWLLTANDANIDAANFYGVSMQHGGAFLLNNSLTSMISCLYIDVSSATIDNSEQLRNSIINANTVDGTAFMSTDDITDIVFCSFSFSDGHAIELDSATPTAQTNKGNLFSGYTNTINSTDAAILNSAAGALTITNASTTNLNLSSYRNTGGGSVTIEQSVTITITIVDSTGVGISGVQVSIYLSSDNSEVMNTTTNGSGVATASFTGSTPSNCYIRWRKSSTGSTRYIADSATGVIASSTGLTAQYIMRTDDIAQP
jgi:hypothetical protein